MHDARLKLFLHRYNRCRELSVSCEPLPINLPFGLLLVDVTSLPVLMEPSLSSFLPKTG